MKFCLQPLTTISYPLSRPCYGKWVRLICNLALQDLPSVRQVDALVANKFNLAVDPRAPVCQWRHLRERADEAIKPKIEEETEGSGGKKK